MSRLLHVIRDPGEPAYGCVAAVAERFIGQRSGDLWSIFGTRCRRKLREAGFREYQNEPSDSFGA